MPTNQNYACCFIQNTGAGATALTYMCQTLGISNIYWTGMIVSLGQHEILGLWRKSVGPLELREPVPKSFQQSIDVKRVSTTKRRQPTKGSVVKKRSMQKRPTTKKLAVSKYGFILRSYMK